VNNYEESQFTLNRLQDENPKFAKFLQAAEDDPICRGLNLTSLLIMVNRALILPLSSIHLNSSLCNAFLDMHYYYEICKEDVES